jgi:hypothetical protein
MGIKIKNMNPRSTDLKPDDIIINTKEGTIFYKNSNNDLFRIQGDNLSTPQTEIVPPGDSLILSGSVFMTGSVSINGGSF